MTKIDKDKVKQVAKSILFDIDDNVLISLTDFFEEHLKEIANLKSIDTTNVAPMIRIDNSPIAFLREDLAGESLPKEKLLANAAATHLGFVAVPKKGESND